MGTEPDDAEARRIRPGTVRPTVSAASMKSVIHRPRGGNAKNQRRGRGANAKPPVILRSVHDATLGRFLQPH
jgi:hypothetical protein